MNYQKHPSYEEVLELKDNKEKPRKQPTTDSYKKYLIDRIKRITKETVSIYQEAF